MPKSLADGHIKFTLLTTKPADPANPTATELNAGIDASCDVLFSDFTWTAADSDKVADRALCAANNANALGASNYSAGFTPFRYFDETTGQVDLTEDALFQAVKVKGSELWGYVRRNGNEHSEDWASGEEFQLGLHFITDTPQAPSDAGGYIKYRVPVEPQMGWDFGSVAAGV